MNLSGLDGIPITASPLVLGLSLMGTIGLFHVIFLRLLPLGPLAWKRVDYIWLGAAALGLIASAEQVRILWAQQVVDQEREYMTATYERLVERVDFLRSEAICRHFARSGYSPPNIDEVQAEYDRACELGSTLAQRLPSTPPAIQDMFELMDLPSFTDPTLSGSLAGIERAGGEYIDARNRYDQIELAGEHSDAWIYFTLLGPSPCWRISIENHKGVR